MSFRITVTEITSSPGVGAEIPPTGPVSSSEIFTQLMPELDLRKFVVALNQSPRGRPAKAAKVAKEAGK